MGSSPSHEGSSPSSSALEYTSLPLSRQTHTAIFFLYSANVYLCTTKSVDALQTFLRACILLSSILVRTVGLHGIIHGRCDSPIGRNALLCMRRYGVTQSELLSGMRIDEFVCTGHSTEENC